MGQVESAKWTPCVAQIFSWYLSEFRYQYWLRCRNRVKISVVSSFSFSMVRPLAGGFILMYTLALFSWCWCSSRQRCHSGPMCLSCPAVGCRKSLVVGWKAESNVVNKVQVFQVCERRPPDASWFVWCDSTQSQSLWPSRRRLATWSLA